MRNPGPFGGHLFDQSIRGFISVKRFSWGGGRVHEAPDGQKYRTLTDAKAAGFKESSDVASKFP